MWTKEEEKFLINNSKYGVNYCSKKLNRSVRVLRKKAKEINVLFNNIRYVYDKDELCEVIKKSKSYADIFRFYNKVDNNSARKILKKYIDLFEIDISHFNNSIDRYNNTLRKLNSPKPLEKILVTGSTYDRSSLKKRLIKDKLIEYKCQSCGIIDEWNGEKLSLQLDHINGVNNDNRLENLRFLCPNCHSQTKTYSGKNSFKDKRKPIKTKEEKKQNRINGHISQRKVERPPYEQLKREIKHYGYTGTGKKYGVSDNAIRKWIKYYEKYINIQQVVELVYTTG